MERKLFINMEELIPMNVAAEIVRFGYKADPVLPKTDFPILEPFDLGFYADSRFLSHQGNEWVEELADVRQPRLYSTSEVKQMQKPVVAKNLRLDGGQGVFLLPEVLHRNAFVDGCPDLVDWVFQEYIDNPSEYYASFRILADGLGNIHYSYLARSADKKGVRKLPSGITDIVPRSALGGSRIYLDGRRIEDEIDREVLKMHGINPDNAILPGDLTEKGSNMGKLLRGHFPLVGIDFMMDKGLQRYYLEFNAHPGLDAYEFGLTQEEVNRHIENPNNEGETQDYLERVVVRKMLGQAGV